MLPSRIVLSTGNYHHIRDGVSLTLNRLVAYLLERSIDVRVLAPEVASPDLKHAGTLLGVPSVPAPGRPEYRVPLGIPPGVRRQVAEFSPDLVHIATPDPVGHSLLGWARRNRVPVASSFHTNFISYLGYYRLGWLEPFGWRLIRNFYNRCDHVYVPTGSMRDELVSRGVEPGRLRLWQRGVDTKLFNPGRRDAEWRRSRGFADTDVVVLYVSRLVAEKNTDLFADVVRTLRQRDPGVKGLVVGEGPARESMRRRLPDGVFTGRLQGEELACAYASSDLFYFPSTTETFGNVTLEAMASGLPCVVADASGGSSLVMHAQTGYVVDTGGMEPSIRALSGLIGDPGLRAELGRAARAASLDFTYDGIHSRILAYYKELLGTADRH